MRSILVEVVGILPLLHLNPPAGGCPMLWANPTVARLGLFQYRATPQLFVLGMIGNLAAISSVILWSTEVLSNLTFFMVSGYAFFGRRLHKNVSEKKKQEIVPC